MLNQQIDYRSNKKTNKMTIIYKSKKRLSDIVNDLSMDGYKTMIEDIHYQNQDESYEITFNVRRKVKSFEPFLSRLNHDEQCESLYLVDYVNFIREED